MKARIIMEGKGNYLSPYMDRPQMKDNNLFMRYNLIEQCEKAKNEDNKGMA